MTSKAKGTWIRGKVKGVPSGDTLVIMGMGKTTSGVPPEKTITLSSLMAPRLARQGRPDDPFAWQSREFLRSLCLGKEVVFQVDYSARGREYGTVCVGDKHIAFLVVAQGWAKVWDVKGKEKGNGEFSPHLKKLLRLQEQAKEQRVGIWSEVPGASQYAVRKLPPSAVSNPASLDVMALLNELKGSPTMAFVENVRDGSTVRVYLLPDYLFVQVFVAGIQAPSMGKRIVEPEKASSEAKGITSNGGHGTLLASSAQKKASSPASVTRSDPDPYGRESKHFTEISVLHRYVNIVLEGVDKYNNLVGSVYYPDGEQSKNLAEQLVENGLAKYVDWSADLLHDDEKQRRLKSLELEAKKNKLRMWTNYTPPPTNSRPIADQNFTGKVVNVVSGDCIVVSDDSAERRVNLSSIRCHFKLRGDAREFLRKRLIGHQVHVSMEYSRNTGEGPNGVTPKEADRVMEFGSVFLDSPLMNAEDDALNIAEMMVTRGFAEVVRHREFEVRSKHYEALLDAESRANVKEEIQVVATEVLGGGKFYVQLAEDQKVASIQQELASLKLTDAPVFASFKPKKDDLVLAQFSGDNSWNRALIVNAPRGAIASVKDEFEVFYIDYGTQEVVTYSQLRPMDSSVSSSPGLAQLCSLAYIKVPNLKEPYGLEAARCLSDYILNGKEFKAIIEESDTSRGSNKGRGTKTTLMVTLVDEEADTSINEVMLEKGLASVETRRGPAGSRQKIAGLEKYQKEARKQRLGIWDDDDKNKPPVRKAGGKK